MAKKHNNIRLSLQRVHEYNFINEIDDVLNAKTSQSLQNSSLYNNLNFWYPKIGQNIIVATIPLDGFNRIIVDHKSRQRIIYADISNGLLQNTYRNRRDGEVKLCT